MTEQNYKNKILIDIQAMNPENIWETYDFPGGCRCDTLHASGVSPQIRDISVTEHGQHLFINSIHIEDREFGQMIYGNMNCLYLRHKHAQKDQERLNQFNQAFKEYYY
ncbi:MAG: hypothetical protein LBK26_03790 [Rickettsiales bacterium]|jgi:hypothetical protein|nr:hypothetical protein [Rickettsiales bacterium]